MLMASVIDEPSGGCMPSCMCSLEYPSCKILRMKKKNEKIMPSCNRRQLSAAAMQVLVRDALGASALQAAEISACHCCTVRLSDTRESDGEG